MHASLALPVLLSFFMGIAAVCCGRRWVSSLAVLTATATCVLYAQFVPQVLDGHVITSPFWQITALDIVGGLRLDGLGALFAVLISAIGALVFLYAGRYLHGDTRRHRLLVVLLFFMGSMLGAVTADDVIILFIFWELTSLASFFLIGYDHEIPEARHAALQSLLITAGGGLALLAGFILIADAAGTTSLSGILGARAAVLSHPQSMTAMGLIILGCFTKSAQFPFHFWLPNAMAAPTPVSAYLHSATMVKLGVYLLARLSPLYSGTAAWHGTLVLFGALTAFTGILLAFRHTDLKRILAYTTVSALGLLTLLLGAGTELAIIAALAFLMVHALYKASLFLLAGIIDHATGVRDIRQLRGLGRAMPLTAVFTALAALSMAGVPPLLGFVAKELVYESLLAGPHHALATIILTFVVNAGTVALAILLSVRIFAGPRQPTPVLPHDPPWAMLTGPAVLATIGLIAGVALSAVTEPWIRTAATAVLGYPTVHALSMWHGLTPVLGLSAVTIALGILLYCAWTPVHRRLVATTAIDRLAPERAYDAILAGMLSLAHGVTMFVQGGSLRTYLRTLFAVATAALLVTLLGREAFLWPGISVDPLDLRYLAFVGIIVGALAAARARTAFVAVIAAGLTGFGAALVFLFFGAPDVSFTQFSVETLLVVILASTLAQVPIPTADIRSRSQKRCDAVIGIAFGAAITLTLLSLLAVPLDLRLTAWFGENSLLAARGRNVVNVILVDFRALDTLGETTVLAIAAFAVHSLLRRARRVRALPAHSNRK